MDGKKQMSCSYRTQYEAAAAHDVMAIARRMGPPKASGPNRAQTPKLLLNWERSSPFGDNEGASSSGRAPLGEVQRCLEVEREGSQEAGDSQRSPTADWWSALSFSSGWVVPCLKRMWDGMAPRASGGTGHAREEKRARFSSDGAKSGSPSAEGVMIPRSLAGALAVLMVAVIEPEDDDAVEQDYTTVQELIQQGTLPGDQAPSSHEPGASSGPEDAQATASREDSEEQAAEVGTTNSEIGWLDQEEPAVAVRVQHWQNGRWGRS